MHSVSIRARMGSSVVGDPTLPLDGVLLYYAALAAYGELPQAQRPNAVLSYDPELLPIVRLDDGLGNWFYACSFAQYETQYVDGYDYLNKRLDVALIDLAQFKAMPDLKGGYYKLHHMRYSYRFANVIAWYALVTDMSRFLALLKQINALGKETNVGHGLVLEWSVEEIDEDFSVSRDGKATRALPVAFASLRGIRGERAYRTVRPPYWSVGNYCEVVF